MPEDMKQLQNTGQVSLVKEPGAPEDTSHERRLIWSHSISLLHNVPVIHGISTELCASVSYFSGV